MDDSNKKKVVDLFKNSVKPADSNSNVIYINGKGNIVGDGNTIIHANTIIHRPKVEVKTGDGVITAAQKARLTELVKEWLTLRNAVRKTQITFASAWASVNKQAKVNSYHEIPTEKFISVEKWLVKQIAIVNAMPSASAKAPDWRKSRYKSIHARCRQLGIDDERIKYMQDKLGKSSLVELTDKEVMQVYSWIMNKK